MKKFILTAFAAIAMLCMTSCGGPASKAESFNEDMLEAMQDGNIEKFCEILVEQAEYVASLDKDEKEEFEQASEDWEIDNKADVEKAKSRWEKTLEKASEKDKQAMKEALEKAAKAAAGKDVDKD